MLEIPSSRDSQVPNLITKGHSLEKWRQAVRVLITRSFLLQRLVRCKRLQPITALDSPLVLHLSSADTMGKRIPVPGGYIPTQETKQRECWKNEELHGSSAIFFHNLLSLALDDKTRTLVRSSNDFLFHVLLFLCCRSASCLLG